MSVEFNKIGVILAGGDNIGENLLQGSCEVGVTNSIPGWVNNWSAPLIEKTSDGCIHWSGNITNSKYIPSVTTSVIAPCEFGKSYTYSVEVKFDIDVNLTTSTPVHFWYGARNTNNIFNVSCNGNLSNRSVRSLTPTSGLKPAGQWFVQQYVFTFGNSATSEGYIYPAIRAFVYGAVLSTEYTGTINGWLRNAKIEAGTIPTSWCQNSNDVGYVGSNHGLIETTTLPSRLYDNHIETIEYIEY